MVEIQAECIYVWTALTRCKYRAVGQANLQQHRATCSIAINESSDDRKSTTANQRFTFFSLIRKHASINNNKHLPYLGDELSVNMKVRSNEPLVHLTKKYRTVKRDRKKIIFLIKRIKNVLIIVSSIW